LWFNIDGPGGFFLAPAGRAAKVLVCGLDNLLGTHGRMTIPFTNRHACFEIFLAWDSFGSNCLFLHV